MSIAIYDAFCEHLSGLGFSPAPEIIYPRTTTEPPDTGNWLEIMENPNEPERLSWGNNQCYNARGNFQIGVGFRAESRPWAYVNACALADAVVAHYPEGLELGPVKVFKSFRRPSVTNMDNQAQLFIPVTIQYQGLTIPE